MKYLSTLLVVMLLLSCKTDPPPPPVPEKVEKKPVEAPKPDLETERWNIFWNAFKVAVANDDAEAVAKLTVFPLAGLEPMVNGQAMTREKFLANYADIFTKEAKQTVATTTANMGDFVVKKEATAKKLHVPLNTKIRSINVLYIYDKGTDAQTESSVIFHFAKINNTYKLVSTLLAG